MKHLNSIFLPLLLFAGCKNQSFHSNEKSAVSVSGKHKDSDVRNPVHNGMVAIKLTHLHDTFFARGNFILFLVPDSARFESFEEDPTSGIYDTDSDFGFGISATEDGVKKNKKYKNIRLFVSQARYITIDDCKTCPFTIDRDSVNYGVLLSGEGMHVSEGYGFVHSGNYLHKVDDFFGLK